jgi:hypothetical protein
MELSIAMDILLVASTDMMHNAASAYCSSVASDAINWALSPTTNTTSTMPTATFHLGVVVFVRIAQAMGRKGNGQPLQMHWRAMVVSVEDGKYTI